ncbi:hypothetical protein ACHWQZ_G004742 [Mnemiopsis leidyi]
MESRLLKYLLYLTSLLSLISSTVVELGPEFGDQSRLEQPHLVMFYAPWCGHCKSLHPVWYELGNKLTRHPVTVARIDATLYRSAAETYNVRGFPTIRLIGKDRTLEYVGDRTSVALTEFAIKGSRPLMPSVGSAGKLRDLQKSDDVIFLSVGTSDDTRKCLSLVAPQTVHETIIAEVTNDGIVMVDKNTRPTYINDDTELRPDLSISKSSGVIVLKDKQVFEYTGSLADCINLVEWIKSERFSTFQVGSYPVIHPLLFLKYKIVFYYGEDEDRVSEMKELSSNRGSLAGDFYFVQINKAEYIENLISAFAEVGSVIIYEPGTEVYSYSIDHEKSIKSSVEDFIKNKATLYGGTGFLAGTKKVWYRLSSNVLPLFYDHPFIMGIVLVVPIGLLLLCCCDEQRSKDDPIRQVRASESHMDLLWDEDSDSKKKIKSEEEDEEKEEEEVEKDEKEEEDAEEKDPDLKKEE